MGSAGDRDDQLEDRVSKAQREPFSSIHVIAGPPRPENTYIFSWTAVDADPTRAGGDSEVDDVIVENAAWEFGATCKHTTQSISSTITQASTGQ